MLKRFTNIAFCRNINIIFFNIYLVVNVKFVRIVVTIFYNKGFKYYYVILYIIIKKGVLCIKILSVCI